MAITSTEIHEQSFKVDRKGYNVEEVDIFLERLADEVDWFNGEIERLNKQIEELSIEAAKQQETVVIEKPVVSMTETEKDVRIRELESKLEDRKMDDNAIAKALIVAQRSGDEIIARSKSDADRIVADAEEESQRILNKANAEKQRIVDTINNLATDREAVRVEYQDLLKAFISSASQKLAEVGGDLDNSSYAMPRTQQEPKKEAELEPVKVSPAVATYTTPQPVASKAVTPITPKPSKPEKDLSGFGDADDAFAFDDVE